MTKKVKRRECDRCPAAPEYLFGSFFENELLCWDCAEDEKGGAMGNRRGL